MSASVGICIGHHGLTANTRNSPMHSPMRVSSAQHSFRSQLSIRSTSTLCQATGSATHSDSAESTLAIQAPPTLSNQQCDQHHAEADSFTPLTKARKMSKPALTALPPSKLQQARKVAGYAALAVGAGVAMTALAVDVTDAAIAGAVLAAGAAVLPASGVGADKRARRSDKGGAAPLLGAIALGMDAAQALTRAISPNTSSGSLTPSSGAQSQLTAAESSLSTQTVQDVTVSEWEDEEDENVPNPMFQYSDAEWALRAKLIEKQPCQVPPEDVLVFAQQFDPAYRLPGQSSNLEQGENPAYRQPAQPIEKVKAERRETADQAKRKEKLKQKQKKKRRKRRK